MSESGFIFNPGTGDSFSLNQIGLEIVNLLKHEKSDKEIISGLLDRYEVDRASIDKYYHDFIAMLQYYQLLEKNG